MKSSPLLLLFAALAVAGHQHPCFAATAKNAEKHDKFAATVHRYFESSKSYRRGDLITQSQLAEMQAYLRKTKGHSPATHPKLLKRTLPDESRLSRYFHADKNSDLLRVAAEKNGGYADLDRISRNAPGRKTMEAYLKTGNLGALVEKLAEMPGEKSPKKISRIYTVDDYVAAVRNLEKKPNASAKNAVNTPEIQK